MNRFFSELLDEISIGAANKYSDLSYKIAPTLFLEFQGSQAYITSQVEATGNVYIPVDHLKKEILAGIDNVKKINKQHPTVFFRNLLSFC